MAITVLSVSGPVYASANGDTVDVIVVTKEFGTIPYTCAANDSTEYGQQIWEDLQSGEHGPIAPYVAPATPPVPVDPFTDLINVLIANSVITPDQLQQSTVSTVNNALVAAGKVAISMVQNTAQKIS